MQAYHEQLAYARRLIVASNRGPVEFQLRRDKSLKGVRGAGGMVTALIAASNSMEVTWVAMAMTEGDRIAVQQAKQNGGRVQSPLRDQKMKLRYVAIPKPAYQKYYEKVSNGILWFAQHYLYDLIQSSIPANKLRDVWENGYCVANRAIAEEVNAEIEREDTMPVVMLQDYHLYLAPELIRQRHPTIVMQQFIHIPWPDMRCWYFLPEDMVQAIYRGLLGNNIIGFQTNRDARNFLEGVETLLPNEAEVDFEDGTILWRGRSILVRAYPISIAVDEERRTVRSSAGRRAVAEIQPLLAEKTIVRVDRIDPTKNIVRGFQAYDMLLDQHPELRGKVTFLARLVPSRQSLPVYRRYDAEVQALIEEINRKYGYEGWKPIQAFYGNDRTWALAAMKCYDVLLVNPIIDGMNLVAKEGPAVNEKDGVLVLSRTAGAFQQLGKGSIPTSPLYASEIASALYQALTLSPEERRVKSTLARHAVERSTLEDWLSTQIKDVNLLLKMAEEGNKARNSVTVAAVVGE
jgi:trehalose 6-phosphate synthase